MLSVIDAGVTNALEDDAGLATVHHIVIVIAQHPLPPPDGCMGAACGSMGETRSSVVRFANPAEPLVVVFGNQLAKGKSILFRAIK